MINFIVDLCKIISGIDIILSPWFVYIDIKLSESLSSLYFLFSSICDVHLHDRLSLVTYIISYYLSLIHISEPTRLLSISYAVFCLKKKIFFFFNDTATTEIYTRSLVGSVRCV